MLSTPSYLAAFLRTCLTLTIDCLAYYPLGGISGFSKQRPADSGTAFSLQSPEFCSMIPPHTPPLTSPLPITKSVYIENKKKTFC